MRARSPRMVVYLPGHADAVVLPRRGARAHHRAKGQTVSRLADAQAALEQPRRQRADAPLTPFCPPAELVPVDEAIVSAHEHALTGWKAEALEAVRRVAERYDELTVESVAWPGTEF